MEAHSRLAAHPKNFLQSSRNRVDLQSYESKPTDKQEQYDCRAMKSLDGWSKQDLKKIGTDLPELNTHMHRNVETKKE